MFSLFSKHSILVASVFLFLLVASAQGAYDKPWDSLTSDSWIVGSPSVLPRMYAANSSVEYALEFGPKNKKDEPSGMKAITFNNITSYQTGGQTGSFDITTGGTRSFGAVLILVAIDADTLGGDFSFTMNGDAYNAADHFTYYDPGPAGENYDTGRPTGNYSGVTPTTAPLSYKFTEGMVSLLAIEGITFSSSAPVTVNYSFANLPGTAVFSAYGVPLDDFGQIWIDEIGHTNNGGSSGYSPTSSFEVVPEPGSLAMLACASVLILKRRRSRKL